MVFAYFVLSSSFGFLVLLWHSQKKTVCKCERALEVVESVFRMLKWEGFESQNGVLGHCKFALTVMIVSGVGQPRR